jgi:diacylglycerol kinase family enzyme
VVATFDRLLAEGVDGTVTEAVTGPNGVVTEIQRHDDRRSAVAALG